MVGPIEVLIQIVRHFTCYFADVWREAVEVSSELCKAETGYYTQRGASGIFRYHAVQ